jgi:Domain of unknown function (DUF1990)
VSTEELTYAAVGASIASKFSDASRHDRYEAEIGHGVSDVRRAVTGLQGWKAHQAIGIEVFPEPAEIRTGATVIVTMGLSTFSIAEPCRMSASSTSPTDGASRMERCQDIRSKARSASSCPCLPRSRSDSPSLRSPVQEIRWSG